MVVFPSLFLVFFLYFFGYTKTLTTQQLPIDPKEKPHAPTFIYKWAKRLNYTTNGCCHTLVLILMAVCHTSKSWSKIINNYIYIYIII